LEGTSKLFVYGTLLIDDVINTLIDRIPTYRDATAPGWRVVRLLQRVYPGLVPGTGEANGKVFTDLTDAEWNTLDAFEDPTYTLTTVRVLSPVETYTLTYIWQGEHVDQPWSRPLSQLAATLRTEQQQLALALNPGQPGRPT
jgi:gamma-glutamylcyclotransferase (GGCT)/AIG2-like uncharacterized protein YtfP